MPALDVIDIYNGNIKEWISKGNGRTPTQFVRRLAAEGIKALIVKATEGDYYNAGAMGIEAVGAAIDIGLPVACYHVNKRADATLGHVTSELQNLFKFTVNFPGIPVMVDWETWGRSPIDPRTGGTLEQTKSILYSLKQANYTVVLYGGHPMVPRGLNDQDLLRYPWVYPNYGQKSWVDPCKTAETLYPQILFPTARMMLHQWGAQVIDGCEVDANRIIGTSLFNSVFHPDPTEEIVSALDTLRNGSKGEQVRNLQNLINGKPWIDQNNVPLVVDGIFGNQTERVVMQYQAYRKLVVDGVVGQQTWRDVLNVNK